MFVLSSGPVVTDYPYTDGVTVSFRRFEGEERDIFDKQRSAISGRKGFDAKFKMLLQQVAVRLCTGWKGITGPDQQPIECTDANKAEFFAHPDAQKYWWVPIFTYLFPSKVADQVDGPELPEAEDPDFFTTK